MKPTWLMVQDLAATACVHVERYHDGARSRYHILKDAMTTYNHAEHTALSLGECIAYLRGRAAGLGAGAQNCKGCPVDYDLLEEQAERLRRVEERTTTETETAEILAPIYATLEAVIKYKPFLSAKDD